MENSVVRPYSGVDLLVNSNALRLALAPFKIDCRYLELAILRQTPVQRVSGLIVSLGVLYSRGASLVVPLID